MVNAAVQGVPLAQDLHQRLVDKPGRAEWLPVAADLPGKRRSELLHPTQDRPSADIDPATGQEARDAFGGGTQLQVITDGEQDDIAWEAMA
jgi:hypothetical protein